MSKQRHPAHPAHSAHPARPNNTNQIATQPKPKPKPVLLHTNHNAVRDQTMINPHFAPNYNHQLYQYQYHYHYYQGLMEFHRIAATKQF